MRTGSAVRTIFPYLLLVAVGALLTVIGVLADSTAFLGSLLGVWVSVAVVLVFESLLRPQIQMDVERAPVLVGTRLFLRIVVRNPKMPFLLICTSTADPLCSLGPGSAFFTMTTHLCSAGAACAVVGRARQNHEPSKSPTQRIPLALPSAFFGIRAVHRTLRTSARETRRYST